MTDRPGYRAIALDYKKGCLELGGREVSLSQHEMIQKINAFLS